MRRIDILESEATDDDLSVWRKKQHCRKWRKERKGWETESGTQWLLFPFLLSIRFGFNPEFNLRDPLLKGLFFCSPLLCFGFGLSCCHDPWVRGWLVRGGAQKNNSIFFSFLAVAKKTTFELECIIAPHHHRAPSVPDKKVWQKRTFYSKFKFRTCVRAFVLIWGKHVLKRKWRRRRGWLWNCCELIARGKYLTFSPLFPSSIFFLRCFKKSGFLKVRTRFMKGLRFFYPQHMSETQCGKMGKLLS